MLLLFYDLGYLLRNLDNMVRVFVGLVSAAQFCCQSGLSAA